MKKLLLTLCALGIMSVPSFAQKGASAPAVAVGIVDVETIVKELPEAVIADKALKEVGQKWQDTLLTMRKDLETKFQQYQKQKAMMPQDQQQKEEENLQILNQKMMQYNEQKFGNTGELNIKREQLLEPIRTKIRQTIESVAKEEKITIVMDKGSSSLLYFDTKFDITYRVLDKIKRGDK